MYEIDELNEIEKKWIDTVGEGFLIEIEKTAMSKSYKIPVLLSFIKGDKMVTEVSIEEVGECFMDYYSNDKVHSKDFRDKKHKNWKQWSLERYTKEAVQNPIKFLSRSKFFAIEIFYESTEEELIAIYEIVQRCKEIVDAKYKPTGYNIGININESAGQTIMHLHVHMIPRYDGDVEDPRGGIRNLKSQLVPYKG